MSKFKWEEFADCFQNSKIICIHGIQLTEFIPIALLHNNHKINITLVPYSEFISEYKQNDFMNGNELVECDIVAIISSCGNNTLEVQVIKTVISALYFAERLSASVKRTRSIYSEYRRPNVMQYHDFFLNYTIDGYWDDECINHGSWYVNIGKKPLDNDSFERWLTRVYGTNLAESYNRRDGIERRCNKILISVQDDFKECLRSIMEKINGTDQYAKKLRSALRLYYEVLCDFKNVDHMVILYSTIFEILLLEKKESSQRKLVAVRAACITADNLEKNYKEFVADQVYNFYRYRNAIVHDGMGILDFENEPLFNASITRMKSVIFCIIKYILDNEIKDKEEIVNVVTKNRDADGLQKAFHYINTNQFDNNPAFVPCIIFND